MITEKEAIKFVKDLRKTLKKAHEYIQLSMEDEKGEPIHYKRLSMLISEYEYDVFDVILKMIERR